MDVSKLGNYFEDFKVGETISHSLSKTIFESDNNLFSLLTMNHHPIHVNNDYAQKNQHGKILVVGTLVFSTAVGITVPDISGKAIANLEYENVNHLAPVFINDTIYAKTKILDKKEFNELNKQLSEAVEARKASNAKLAALLSLAKEVRLEREASEKRR